VKSLIEKVEQDKVVMMEAYRLLMNNGNVREAGILQLGCNLPLKPFELLRLKHDQLVFNGRGESYIRASNGAKTLAPANEAVKAVFERRKAVSPNDSYLFSGRKVMGVAVTSITRQAVSVVLRAVTNDELVTLGMLRKVWARRYLLETGDLSSVSTCLNHASKPTTFAYLGLAADDAIPMGRAKPAVAIEGMNVSALFLDEVMF
jgi:integrase